KRRQRSAAGGAAGRRSALIVPSKRGNGPTRTAGREARRRIVEPLGGKTANASKFEHRVNETTTGSTAGETVAADGIHFPGVLMDMDWLHEAFQRTRQDGVVGVDGITGAAYEADLEANLRSLLDAR